MSTALTLEQESGSNTSYTLAGIYTQPWITFGPFYGRFWKMWAYDGMVNSTQPSLDPITEDAQLTTLGDRAMHILLYHLGLHILPL